MKLPKQLDFIKTDAIYIIMIILCLAAIIYTLSTVGDAQEKINQHWVDQWEASGCGEPYYLMNKTYDIKTLIIPGVFINESQDKS